jgi:trk system potassium uptake protein TrkA
VGDGREIAMLEEIGAEDADAAVVSTGDDMTASILATMALKDLGVERVYVKVISDDHTRIMHQLGVAETVFPERASGYNLASSISEKGVLDYVRMGRNLSVQELVVPEEWRGHTLRELDVRSAYDVSVVGIHDTAVDEMIVPPDPDDTLRRTDTLILAGRDEAIEAVAALASATAKDGE